jgi:large subunit ribosomal protein L30
MSRKIRVTYVRSAIGYNVRQKRTIKALGLRRLGDVVSHDDSPAVRGMVNKVSHLVQVEEVVS